MENHDTFNPSNILELENWTIVFQALLKMGIFFWPIVVLAFMFVYLDSRKTHHR